MAERELFVVCNNCGNEVSPYVTECPYCGHRLRKRAPDLKKQKKAEEREAKKAEKRRARLKSQYEGGGGAAPGDWLQSPTRPVATALLILTAVIASLLARSGIREVSDWMLTNLMLIGDVADQPLTLLTAPFLQFWFGYGFVCLGVFALFGAGIERRYGRIAVVVVWLVCGASGLLVESLVAASSYGAYGVAAGTFVTWVIVVVNREDLRDYDALGLCAVAAVLCALPLATTAASVWTLVGGIAGGLICGGVLTRLPSRG